MEVIRRLGLKAVKKILGREDAVKVKLVREGASMPSRGSDGAAGWDVFAVQSFTIPAGESLLVNTGVSLELPRGTYARLAPRSGLMIKGIEIGPGLVDRDYRGEVRALVINRSGVEFSMTAGDRFCQLVFERIYEGGLVLTPELGETQRGFNGFGSTGLRSLNAEPTALSSRGESLRRRATGGTQGDGLERCAGRDDGGPQLLSSEGFESSVQPVSSEGLDGSVQPVSSEGLDGSVQPRSSEGDLLDPRVLWHTEWGSVYHKTPKCLKGCYKAFKLEACEKCFGPGEWPPTGEVRVAGHIAHSVLIDHGTGHRSSRKVLTPCRQCVHSKNEGGACVG